MGNVCCAHDDEEWKCGAWYDEKDEPVKTEDEKDDGDVDEYDAKAIEREEQIMRHQKQIETGVHETENGDSPYRRLKRLSITATPMCVDSQYCAPSFPKSSETTEFLLKAMGDNFVFDSVDEGTKLQFADAMQPQEYQEGEWIMRQGDVGDYFYIVEEGEVAIHVAGAEELSIAEKDPNYLPPQVGTGSRGSTFGELALLYNTPRAASIRALTTLKLYKIEQVTFRSLLMSNLSQDRSNRIALLREITIFQDLDDAKVQKLADAFTVVEFGPGDRIVNKGDHGCVMYIIKSGQVKVDNIGHGHSKYPDRVLKEGNFFGDRALITGETRAADVTAVTPSSLLAISKGVFEEIIGPLEQANWESRFFLWLSNIPILDYLEREEIMRCVKCLKRESFKEGDKLPTTQGKLYLIEQGHALMMIQKDDDMKEIKDNERRKAATESTLVKFESGDYFMDSWGATEIMGPGQSMTENVINVEADMKCLTLLTSDIQNVIGCTSSSKRASLIADNSAGMRKKIPQNGCKKLSIFHTRHSGSFEEFIKTKITTTNRDVMNLSKLNKHRILGVGTFGKVWLVTPKSNTEMKPTPYALKMISKRHILRQRLAAAVMREKNVMESIENPFLLHMVSSFQDDNYLYFVLDLVLGGELFELLYARKDKKKAMHDNVAWKKSSFYKSFGRADEKPIIGLAGLGVRKAVFYSACVIEAFSYLHNRHIVYRDLKPENVLLNEKGYCVVVDMGFAKVVLDKTYTMCGTPEYLAPEVISHKGHNHVADYWSFACILYELVVGQTPFFRARIDQLSLIKNIIQAQYAFPSQIGVVSSDNSNGVGEALNHWKDLVSRLLKPNPVERLGNLRNGIEDILDHDWFSSIDFREFRDQSMPAPWIPLIVNPLDTSNFENGNLARHEQPEVFRTVLSSKDQEAFKGF